MPTNIPISWSVWCSFYAGIRSFPFITAYMYINNALTRYKCLLSCEEQLMIIRPFINDCVLKALFWSDTGSTVAIACEYSLLSALGEAAVFAG